MLRVARGYNINNTWYIRCINDLHARVKLGSKRGHLNNVCVCNQRSAMWSNSSASQTTLTLNVGALSSALATAFQQASTATAQSVAMPSSIFLRTLIFNEKGLLTNINGGNTPRVPPAFVPHDRSLPFSLT